MNTIQNKTYQRIDTAGNWLETVEVSPTITQLEDKSYQVEYIADSDLIDADAPDDITHRWDGTGWQPPEIIIPPMPDSIMVRQIDDDGYYLCDVLIDPSLVDGVWVHVGIDSVDYVKDLIPGNAGFYRPRYVNGRWVEGATKAEMAPPKYPDWGKFIIDFTASSLDEMIAQPSNITNVLRLNRLLSMYPALSVPDVLNAWNQCLDGLETAPNKDQRKELIKIIESNNLPIAIGADCRLSEVTNG
jgi:hypothetical protein